MSAIVEIRDARPGEGAALGELHRRSALVWEEDRAALEAHPGALGIAPEAITQGRVRVAVGPGGSLLGFAAVADGGDGTRVLDDLFVDPDAMRQGVGRALVQDAVARAEAAGRRAMTVIAHPRNLPFYEDVGFVPVEPAKTRFGPAVLMRRRLASRGPN